jgi:iron complex outermembrane receptor protein
VKTRHVATLLLGSTLTALSGTKASAQDAPTPAPLPPSGAVSTDPDLSQLSIEELARLPVRSASKREEPLSTAPTALFVITGDEIAQSPANSLAEVLRLAPNLQVQQIDARSYAISARGFNGYESSNKLLVLMDGRSLYSTLHSGVFWELRQPLLEDIQQIEVISGPGGTLYGPNAVNGVVNITTRDARETIGGLLRASYGTDARTIGARYGFTIGDNAAIRFYGNAFARDGLPDGFGPNVDDSISGYRVGFRSDAGAGRNIFTVQGDYFADETDQLPGDGDRGGNVTARWHRDVDEQSSFELQAYYDYFRRRFLLARDALETLDFEAQYNRSQGAHEIVAGLGVRTTRDEFTNNANVFTLDPPSRRLWILNAFVQDRFALTARLSVIAGVKLERSSFSGAELLPNVRLAWRLAPNNLLWAAVSRAVRTPSRIDRDLVGAPILVRATDFRSEKLVAFEAGYRGQPTATTLLTVSVFYNLYDDIRAAEFIGNPLPARLANNLTGHTYGLEAWGSWQALTWWRLSAGVSLLSKHFHLEPGTTDISGAAALGQDPDYQLLLRSSMNLRSNLVLGAGLRAVGGLETPATGSYVEADARLGWAVSDQVELFVAGNNLLHRSHVESNDANRAQRAERSAYLGTRLRF